MLRHIFSQAQESDGKCIKTPLDMPYVNFVLYNELVHL